MPMFPRLSRHDVMLAVVLVVEWALAQFDLSNLAFVNGIANLLQPLLHVIGNFRARGVDGLRAGNYIAVTILGLPMLVVWAFKWAEDHREEARNSLLVTPYSRNASWLRRIVFALMYCLLACLACWYVFYSFGSEFFSGKEALKIQAQQFRMVMSGGWRMWFSWVVLQQLFVATVVGWLAWLLVDWIRFFVGRREPNSIS